MPPILAATLTACMWLGGAVRTRNGPLPNTISERVATSSLTVTHYNILAGYLGDNTSPWFLYGANLTREERAVLMSRALRWDRKEDGTRFRPCTFSNRYCESLYQEATLHVAKQQSFFEWTQRRHSILREFTMPNPRTGRASDIITAVEVDHYEDFFKPNMAEAGYDSVWEKRPGNPMDGCAVFWKTSAWELGGPRDVAVKRVVYEEARDIAAQGVKHGWFHEWWLDLLQQTDMPALSKDRIAELDWLLHRVGHSLQDRLALITHLKSTAESDRHVVVVSTHLMKQPEDLWGKELMRMLELAQLAYELDRFLWSRFPCRREVAPLGCDSLKVGVILTGDFNMVSKKYGAYWLAKHVFGTYAGTPADAVMHGIPSIPAMRFTKLQDAFTQEQEQTMATSVTNARKDWIDYIWYANDTLRVEATHVEPLSGIIPDATHPSDHVPIRVDFTWRH